MLVLLGIGIFIYIKVIDSKLPSTRDSIREGPKVVSLDRDKVSAVIIKNAASVIELRKGENNSLDDGKAGERPGGPNGSERVVYQCGVFEIRDSHR